MTHRPLVRTISAATATALILVLAGCSDDADPSGGGSAPKPSSAVPSTSSEDSTPQTDPSVEPASGPLLKMPNATINAPDGWTKDSSIGDLQQSAASADYRDGIFFTAIELPSGGFGTTLEEQMQSALDTTSEKPKPQPMDPVEIAGVEWYHLQSNGPDGGSDLFGVDHDGFKTSLTISFLGGDDTPAEREAIVASVLASFTWK